MFLETIRCENGIPLHLTYHQMRLERSLDEAGINARFDLKTLIAPPESGVYRCRFLYGHKGFESEFHPYVPRTLSSLKMIRCDAIDYHLKYSDRSALDSLYAQRGECDDVLIVRNGQLSDTTIANIALFIDGQWLTPQTPLLEGTTRARLIDSGMLTPHSLAVDDIQNAEKIALMNAMMGFIEVENGIIA